MSGLSSDLRELREQLAKGSIQRAYPAIVGYMSRLRAHFAGTQGERAVSGLYQGYFDMTYFALFPPTLKSRDLKLAIVFDYEAFGFEVWLAARNRKVQRQYWGLFRDGGWSEYLLVEPAPGIDAIVEHDVASGFELDDPEALTASIELAVETFLGDLERFLEAHDPGHAV
ncbi:MAG: hypothetical protein Q7W30_04375 [Coriobacteriia bacterium]|nr:hypothetical protein [Coriobacteriia bacterium]